jgi:uncharacterized protein (TIGR02117 family)
MPRRLLAAVCLTLLAAACSAPPISVESPDDPVIYVIGRGWHTDIGLPVEELDANLASLQAKFPGVRFFTFGFGERQFLLNRKTNLGTMLNALLPSRSALLLTALRAPPNEAFGPSNVVALHVSSAALDTIEANIWHEFELSSTGEPMLLADGPYPGSVFYAAQHTYDGFYTCNTWTALILRTGGLPMSATGVLFAAQVMGMARWIAAHHAASIRN